jgi:hypothetical protein
VDTLDDCLLLQGHLVAVLRAGHDLQVPHTERLLERFSASPEWETCPDDGS